MCDGNLWARAPGSGADGSQDARTDPSRRFCSHPSLGPLAPDPGHVLSVYKEPQEAVQNSDFSPAKRANPGKHGQEIKGPERNRISRCLLIKCWITG